MENFQRIKVVGKGSYGEVWLCKHTKDQKQYVLKKMDLKKAKKKERQAAEQEAKLLSKLKHPNIVAYKDSFETEGYLWIAMGYCEGGDLYNHLKARRGELLDERQIVEWFVQISMALQYMHERNILHRDLKTQNIFLTRSKIIKLGDLGIARVLESSNDMATTMIGTPYYMSPELFSNKPYNHKSDVWALGCCVYEMATLKHAFNAKDMNSLVYKILKGKMPPMPRQYSEELSTLIRAMLDQNPARRPSVNKILRDPFIKRNIAIFLEGTRNNRRQNNGVHAKSAVDGRTGDGSKERPYSGDQRKDRPFSGDSKHPLAKPLPAERPRPLPQLPAGSESQVPLHKSQSTPKTPSTPIDVEVSQSKTGTGELEEAQTTNPNMSARARRREKTLMNDTPRHSQEGIMNIHLEPKRKGSATSGRDESTKSKSSSDAVDSKAQSPLTNKKAPNHLQQHRQSSLSSYADDDDEETSSCDNEEDRQRKSDEKDVANLEKYLDATLHINSELDDDTIECDEPVPQNPSIHRVQTDPGIRNVPMFSNETLNNSGRLMDRIVALRKDCLNAVGLHKLHKAYQIIDSESEQIERLLVEHLGQDLFEAYAGKIWQLKFCEDSAFKMN